MKSVNKVILIGNLTRDPELKATPQGTSLVEFGLATNRVWKDPNGEKKSLPEFHNIVGWGQLAEMCQQVLHTGSAIYLEGYLKTRSWEKDGIKVFRTEVVAENVVFLDKRPADERISVDEVEENA